MHLNFYHYAEAVVMVYRYKQLLGSTSTFFRFFLFFFVFFCFFHLEAGRLSNLEGNLVRIE